ncbi:MAG: hypothetical protein ACOH2A_06800 [Sphingobacteriaceae bacterium]
MIKYISGFFFALFMGCFFNQANSQNSSYADAVNVTRFGAKGDGLQDDADALEKAFNYCVLNNKRCFIPKTSAFYNVKRTVRVPIQVNRKLDIVSNNATIGIGTLKDFQNKTIWKISPVYQEFVLFSIGSDAENYTNIATAFNSNQHSTLKIRGLLFSGNLDDAPEVPEKGQKILIALQTSCYNVDVEHCVFKNIYGYGQVSFGVKNYKNISNTYLDVGGRGKTNYAYKIDGDSFGDAIYTTSVKKDAIIKFDDCELTGIRKFKRRSRIGMTFEFSDQPYRVVINRCNIRHYAKGIHLEEKSKSEMLINDCNFEDYNFAIANVNNNGSVCKITSTSFATGFTDGQEQGDAFPFLTMYSNMDISVYRSSFDFKGRKQAYLSFVGVRNMIDCSFSGNNTNPSITDANVLFQSCIFKDFGGDNPTFKSYHGGNTFTLNNCTFIGGGAIHAKGQKVTLSFKNPINKSSNALIPANFN